MGTHISPMPSLPAIVTPQVIYNVSFAALANVEVAAGFTELHDLLSGLF